jgi:hypothetical protein
MNTPIVLAMKQPASIEILQNIVKVTERLKDMLRFRDSEEDEESSKSSFTKTEDKHAETLKKNEDKSAEKLQDRFDKNAKAAAHKKSDREKKSDDRSDSSR